MVYAMLDPKRPQRGWTAPSVRPACLRQAPGRGEAESPVSVLCCHGLTVGPTQAADADRRTPAHPAAGPPRRMPGRAAPQARCIFGGGSGGRPLPPGGQDQAFSAHQASGSSAHCHRALKTQCHPRPCRRARRGVRGAPIMTPANPPRSGPPIRPRSSHQPPPRALPRVPRCWWLIARCR